MFAIISRIDLVYREPSRGQLTLLPAFSKPFGLALIPDFQVCGLLNLGEFTTQCQLLKINIIFTKIMKILIYEIFIYIFRKKFQAEFTVELISITWSFYT